MNAPRDLRRCCPAGRRPRRGGFTLVEMLVVVGIVGLLAAIITPAVMQALASARNAAIKAEIDMLHTALMNYRNEYGSFPPCSVASFTGTDAASKHLLRIFPRVSSVTTQLQCQQYLNIGSSFPQSTSITPETALVEWLYGYTNDPQSPILSTTGAISLAATVTVTGTIQPRKRMYDFDISRVTSGCLYTIPGKTNVPLVYIDSSQYLSSGTVPTFALTTGTYFALRVPTSASGSFTNTSQSAFNPDTFQILCSGRDGVFGTDDDLSNFWPGTRREYLDSL